MDFGAGWHGKILTNDVDVRRACPRTCKARRVHFFSGVHNINDDNLSEGPESRNVAVASGSLDWESLMINIDRKAFDDLSFIG
jgi:hypothetical protein